MSWCDLHVIQWMFSWKIDTEWELHGVQGAECLKDKTALVWASLMAQPSGREGLGWTLHPLVVTFQP